MNVFSVSFNHICTCSPDKKIKKNICFICGHNMLSDIWSMWSQRIPKWKEILEYQTTCSLGYFFDWNCIRNGYLNKIKLCVCAVYLWFEVNITYKIYQKKWKIPSEIRIISRHKNSYIYINVKWTEFCEKCKSSEPSRMCVREGKWQKNAIFFFFFWFLV